MATTSDLALLRRKLAAADYSPAVYVRELASRCVGGHELLMQRKNIQTLSEDTNSLLKKNVYQNYGQFIATAKEISFLESEMYQLSHMITEQKNILTRMAESSILGDKVPLSHDVDEAITNGPVKSEQKEDEDKTKLERSEFEDGRRRMYDLLEKVEGCSHVTDVPSRFLLHDGDLVEMDIADNSALHRVHGYLMNDGFMAATWLPNRRGPVRFKYSCLYELDSLAIVNVRDLGEVKHAFKLLVFPDARLFQCANEMAKQEWMEFFENAKKRRQKELETAALKRSDTITARERARLAGRRNPFVRGGNPVAASNPFFEEDEESLGSPSVQPPPRSKAKKEAKSARNAPHQQLSNSFAEESSEPNPNEDEFELPEWLAEFSEDLEDMLAQREFDKAVRLVFRARSYCTAHAQDSHLVREANTRLDDRTKHLISVLAAELATEKSVQAGPKAARRAVQLLAKLGRSTQACELFLKHRKAILSAALKAVKPDVATVAYVHRLTMALFSNILEANREFTKAFVEFPSKMTSFLTWMNEQADYLADLVEKQISSPSTPLDVTASCISFVREQAIKLRAEGIDLAFRLDAKFRKNVERMISEHRDKQIEAVKLRAHEDRWEPINCYNGAGTERFMEELSAAGIPSARAYVYDDCWVALTRNTTSFSLSYLSFADSLMKLFTPSLRSLINDCLVAVFHSHLRHIEQAIRSDKLRRSDPKFVQRNAAFLLDTLLSLIEHKYQERTKSDCPKLGKLHSSYTWLKEGQPPRTSSSSSGGAAAQPVQNANTTAKYSDPNYI